jgi:hypothetical protein
VSYRIRASRALRGAALIVAATAACLVSCSRNASAAEAAPVVVLITGSEASTPLEYRGAEDLARAYSDGKSGGELRHICLPDRAKGESAVASFIADAASDPRVQALVVEPSPLGTAWGLRKAKDARAASPGGKSLFCVAASSSEDILDIESSADLVVELDRAYRAYIVAWEAKKMGASSLVAAYSPDEAATSDSLRERAIMAAAAADLGLRYAAMVAPKGVEGSAFVRSSSGVWLRDYGPAAALYCARAALAPSLIAGAVAGGGMVVDAAGSATVESYAEALGVDLSGAAGDAKKEKRLVEAAVAAIGMKGRLCAWDAAYGRASVAGLGEFAMRVARGQAKKEELKELRKALDDRSGGAAWLAEYDVDSGTGVKSQNRVLLRQDSYALGSGYLQSALRPVPAKYLLVKAEASE